MSDRAPTEGRGRKPRWREVSRRLNPGRFELHPSAGSGTFAYFVVTWSLVEQAKIDGVIHSRFAEDRKVYYLHEHGDLSAFGSVALTCLQRMLLATAEVDKMRKKAKRAA